MYRKRVGWHFMLEAFPIFSYLLCSLSSGLGTTVAEVQLKQKNAAH